MKKYSWRLRMLMILQEKMALRELVWVNSARITAQGAGK